MSPSSRSPRPRPVPKPFRPLQMGMALAVVSFISAVAGAIVALLLGSSALTQEAQADSIFTTDEAPLTARQSFRFPSLTRPVHVLLLGTKVLTTDVDVPVSPRSRYHALVDSLEGRTDVMLLLRFDPASQRLTVLSIPRDTRTWIEGYGIDKINSANVLGGPALSAMAVSEVLAGLPVDRYVRVNVQGVEKLIDALGGVTLDVPQNMRYQDDSQRLYINLNAGRQHLEGAQALSFLRFRQDQWGDIGRIQRQQLFVRALIEQALTPATLLQLPDILSIIRSHVDTNLSPEELLALSKFGADLNSDNLQLLMLPGYFSEGEYELSYWLPNPYQIEDMLAQHFDVTSPYVTTPRPSTLRIAIQDSSNDPEALDQVIEHLLQEGYLEVYVSSASRREPLDATRIIAQRGDRDSANLIQRSLGFGNVFVETSGSLQSDITIQVGQDWREFLFADREEFDYEEEV